jgi:predicted nuclease with TOPRIM domain
MVTIPSLNMKRVFELMELEKSRPLTNEEFNSCVTEKEITESQFEEIIERVKRLKDENPKLL